MSIFKYVLPSGTEYEVIAPPGTTQAQADKVFYSQVAAGSLAGYSTGQILQSPQTLIQDLELSRLERGTAGVDEISVLALNAGSPVIASPPNLTNVQIQNPITEADVALMKLGLGPGPVGTLSSIEVQGLQAQLAAQVNQPYYVISVELGIGMFGFSSWQLEQLGYLVPGTTAMYLNQTDSATNPPNFIEVMYSPLIWTGLNGVTGVDKILSSKKLQSIIQTAMMRSSYKSLVAVGLITETPTSNSQVMVGRVYSDSGSSTGVLQAVSGSNLLTSPSSSLTQFSVASTTDFVSKVLADPNFLSTQNPATVQSILTAINEKPALLSDITGSQLTSFTNAVEKYSTTSLALSADINRTLQTGVTNLSSITNSVADLRNLTNNIQGSINNALNVPLSALSTASSILGTASGFLNQGAGIINQVQAQVGSLVNTASKFGTQATELWSKGLSGNFDSAMDGVGKMGSYAVKFIRSKISALISSIKSAAGFSNTINRKTVDVAVNRIIGTSSIPMPTFSSPSSLKGAIDSIQSDIKYAQDTVANIQNEVTSTVSQVTAPISVAASTITNLAGEVQGQVNQVIGSAVGPITQVAGTISAVKNTASRITRLG